MLTNKIQVSALLLTALAALSCGTKQGTNNNPTYVGFQESSCAEAINTTRNVSLQTIVGVNGDCDLITVVENLRPSNSAASNKTHSSNLMGFGSNNRDFNIEGIKKKYLETKSEVRSRVGGRDLEKKLDQKLFCAEEDGYSIMSEETSQQTENLSNDAMLAKIDRFRVDMDLGYTESKLARTYNENMEYLVKVGLQHLLNKNTELNNQSAHDVLKKLLPIVELAKNEWKTHDVSSDPFLHQLKQAGVKKEQLIQIAARAYELIENAENSDKLLPEVITEYANTVINDPESVKLAIDKAREAFGYMKDIAKNKKTVMEDINKNAVIIQKNLKIMMDTVEKSLSGNRDFSEIRDGIEAISDSKLLDQFLGNQDRENLQDFKGVVELADLTYNIVNGKKSFDSKTASLMNQLADRFLKNETQRKDFKSAVSITKDATDLFDIYKKTQDESLSESDRVLDKADYSAIANGAISIGKELGIFGKGKQANETAQYLNIAVGAATAFFTGNPTGLINSVGSVLGGGAPDAGAQRHEAVMASLGRIESGISQLKKGQGLILEQTGAIRQDILDSTNRVLDGQMAVMRSLNQGQQNLQRVMTKGFSSLQKQAAANQAKTTLLLQNLHGNVDRISKGVAAILDQDLKTCSILSKRRNQHTSDRTRSQSFVSYQDFEKFYVVNKDFIKSCLLGIQKTIQFIDPTSEGQRLYFSDSLKASITADFEYSTAYQKTVDYLNTYKSSIPSFYSLTKIAGNRTQMEAKLGLEKLSQYMSELGTAIEESLTQNPQTNLANPNAVIYAVKQLLDHHTLFELLDENYEILTEDNFSKGEPSEFNNIGQRLIAEEALPILKSALAQRQLMRGDIVLGLMQRGRCPAGGAAGLYELFYSNRMLAYNAVAYLRSNNGRDINVCGLDIQKDVVENIYLLKNPSINSGLPEAFYIPTQRFGSLLPDPITDSLQELIKLAEENATLHQLSDTIDQQSKILLRSVLTHDNTLSQ